MTCRSILPALLQILALTFLGSRAFADVTITVNVADGAAVGDVTKVVAQARSDSGIVRVEFSVDDQLRATATKPPYEFAWDTVDDDEGRHTLTVAAYDGAGNAAKRRIKVEVDNGLSLGVKPHAAKALERFDADDFDGAMVEARKAYRINMADPDAIRALAAATGGKGDFNRAIDLLEKPQNINNQVIGDPKSFPMADPKSLELRALFRIERAEKQPNAQGVAADLASVYDFWRQAADARLAEARAHHPASDMSPANLLALGDALWQHRDWDEALATYGKAPGTAAANRAALALIASGRVGEAEEKLTATLSAGQGTAATHALMGLVYLRQHKADRARQEVETDARKGSLSCLLILAWGELARQNYSAAYDALKQVAARAPVVDTYYLAAGLLLDANEPKRAPRAAFTALRLDPSNVDSYVLRAYQIVRFASGDGYAQALPLFDFALQRDPGNLNAAMGKALVLIQQKKLHEAAPLVKQLVREDRDAADVWMAQAALYASDLTHNDQVPANEALARARRLAPDLFNDPYVPKIPALIFRVAHYRRPPVLTPALLALEEEK